MLLAAQFPTWLKPEIIPGLPVRWYGLMYFVAFAIAYLLFVRQKKEQNISWSDEHVSNFFFWIILGLLLGARLVSTLVYDQSGEYLSKPWLIFWPFRDGHFVGLQGMSYHGGLIGAVIAAVIYTRRAKMDIRVVGDLLVTGIPLGYTFGRLGNFINGELWGRVTSCPLGIVFPHAEQFSTSESWVREIATRAGISLQGLSEVNLPRHPSQLYEALFEGLLLWAILWTLRNRKPFKGFMIGAYMIGYGAFRFVIEYFREPDAELGYRISFAPSDLPPALFSSPLNFSTGQVFCAAMILGGLIWLLIASRLDQSDPYPVQEIGETPEQKQKNARRNQRKKLK